MQLFCSAPWRVTEVRKVMQHVTATRETDDGVVLEFRGDEKTARALLEYVFAEQQCCPHFTYELTLALRAEGDYLAPLKAMYTWSAKTFGSK
jgi:hypothetical protein